MSVDLLGSLQLASDVEDMELAIQDFKKFLTWTVEEGWSEEQIYRVVKVTLSLLEKG